MQVAVRKARIGQVLNLEKSTLEPVQVLTALLGYVLRTKGEPTIEITPLRVEKELSRVKKVLDRLEPVPDKDRVLGGPRYELWGTPAAGSELYSSRGLLHGPHNRER